MMMASHSTTRSPDARTFQCDSVSEICVTEIICREKRGRFSRLRQKWNSSAGSRLMVQARTSFLALPPGTAGREILVCGVVREVICEFVVAMGHLQFDGAVCDASIIKPKGVERGKTLDKNPH